MLSRDGGESGVGGYVCRDELGGGSRDPRGGWIRRGSREGLGEGIVETREKRRVGRGCRGGEVGRGGAEGE